uniref:Putative reverse transcriptase, RNA-dependent DNA polymerase n=1 Tax=Tanacetum cinerariifolium TaxID=118510 RepID=A0A6L2M4Q3_TANCI|nr:putative reverse transcriptase, RNA-dependent DNA polymerase [Tanacetum cinerariifolium]
MSESSSPDITPKEEPITLDRSKIPNPFLLAIQVEFTFEEIAFIANNEVALLYPSHPNQEYFEGYNREIEVKGTLKKSCLPPRWRLLMGQIIQCLAHKYDNEELTINPTQVFSVHNWTLKPNQPKEPPFTDHMKAIYNLDVPVDSKSPKYSSPTEEVPQGKSLKLKADSKENNLQNTHLSPPLRHPNPNLAIHIRKLSPVQPWTQAQAILHLLYQWLVKCIKRHIKQLVAQVKDRAHPQLSSGPNPSVLVDKTQSAGDGLKTAHTTSSANKESGGDDILRKVKLEDLADILKGTRSAFFTPDSPTDEPIIVSDISEEEENAKNDKDTEDTSFSHPSPKSAQLQELMAQSQKKELEQAKVIAEAEVASMKAKPLYPDINQLTELLEKLKSLDYFSGLLKTVTNTLNMFATLVENTSGSTTTGVPSADKATASPAEREKDVDTNMKNKLVDLLGIDIVTQYYNNKFSMKDIKVYKAEKDCFIPKGIKQSPLEKVLLKSAEKCIRFSLMDCTEDSKRNELKEKITLLLAIPDEHLLKFHGIKDAKTLWEAIKTKFRGNKESKKMQKTILKQQYENFVASRSEGLDKTYDGFQKLISQLEIHGEVISQENANLKLLRSLPPAWNTHSLVMRNKFDLDTLSMDDLYNNLNVCEAEIKVNTAHDVSTASSQGQTFASTYTDDVMFSFFANQSNSPQLDNEDLEQIDSGDLEEMDLKWQVAMHTIRMKRFIKKTRRNLNFNGKEIVGFDKINDECYNYHRRGHFTRENKVPRSQGNRNRDNTRRVVPVETPANALVVTDGMDYDWSYQAEEGPTDFSLMAFSSPEFKNKLEESLKEKDDLKIKLEKFETSSKNLTNLLNSQLSSKDKIGLGYDSQLTEKDLSNKSDVFESASDSSVKKSEKDNNQANDRYKAGEGYHAVPPPYTENVMPSRPDLSFAGLDDSISKSTISEPITSVHETDTEKSVFNNKGKATGQREVRPVWNNAKRVNHQNFSNNLTHPHPKRNFVPTAVITNSGKVPVNAAKQSSPKAAASTSTTRYVNTAANRLTVNGTKPSSNVFHKSHSPVRRTFNQRTAPKNSDLKEIVNTVKVNNVTTAGTKAVVSVVQGNRKNAIKSSACWIRRPTGNVIDHISKDSGSYMLKRFNYVDLQGRLKHMTRNKSFLTDYQKIDGGFVAFRGSPKGGGLTCLFTKAIIDESNLWNRRLGHINFKTMNKLVKRNFVRGLPSKIFENDHTCVACQKGKQHKAYWKADEGFLVGYSVNSKAFRVFNSRTRRVEENLHIKFLENKHNVVGRGPEWLFNIDSLTNSMNYEPVTVGNQTNNDVGIEINANAGKAGQEKASDHEYILLPFVPSSTQSSDDKDAGDVPDNEDDDVSKGSGIDDQDKTHSSTQNVGTAEPSINTTSTNINTGSLNINTVGPNDPRMPSLEETGIFDDVYDDREVGAEDDTNNLELSTVVSHIPTTRVHKDHPKEKIIGNLNLATQIRRMLNFSKENGMMDVKSAFLYGKIEEEVYVCQPPGFEDPYFPNKVYKVEKALYGLHQAPRACQDKYVANILKKFDFTTVKTSSTPIEPNKTLIKDAEAADVDVHLYRSMIGSLMYLTASRPDIMFVVCACARFQVTLNISHLHVVKRIFRYLKGQPKLGLWYPRDSPFDLEGFSDSDYVGASLDRKSTTGGCQFLVKILISWHCKKQTIVVNFTTQAEYVAAASCCGQVLWIQNQMLGYGFNLMNTKIYINNESTICIVKKPVFHSKTKHIEIMHHFIRDSYEKKLIQVIKIHTDNNVVDLLTKAFDVGRFNFLFASIGLLNL